MSVVFFFFLQRNMSIEFVTIYCIYNIFNLWLEINLKCDGFSWSGSWVQSLFLNVVGLSTSSLLSLVLLFLWMFFRRVQFLLLGKCDSVLLLDGQRIWTLRLFGLEIVRSLSTFSFLFFSF